MWPYFVKSNAILYCDMFAVYFFYLIKSLFSLIEGISTAILDLTLPYLTVSMTPCEGVTENMVNTYFMEKEDQKGIVIKNYIYTTSPIFGII